MSVQRLGARDPRGVGPYRFLGRLGSGGMGLVCLARAADGRLVAVKLVHQEIAADPDYRRRFAREVRAATALTGRFTPAILDADPEAPQPWYAAEFIDGPTLGEVVRRTGPLPVRALRALAAGLADALTELETAGLVHRDVKPDNILLAPDGPKLIDFGLARRETDSVLTRAGSVVGSPGYMSPEQIAGHDATTASDVFALGAVLAYAAQGHAPFGTGTSEARLYRTRFGEAQLAAVPQEFHQALTRCLAKAPGDRPTTSELVARWPIRPEELNALIQIGRTHHAAPGAPAGTPTEALPLGRGTSAPVDGAGSADAATQVELATSPLPDGAPASGSQTSTIAEPVHRRLEHRPTAEPWHSPLLNDPLPIPLLPRAPWWHHPVAADRLPGGRLRDVLLSLGGTGFLMFFGLLRGGAAVGVAFAAAALALGFLLGVRRGAIAVAVYSATAVLSPGVLPGGLAAELRPPPTGVCLELVVLVLAAGGIARLGGLAWLPLGFVVGVAAYVAGRAVIVALAAHQSGSAFRALWRADSGGLLIYRDAAIAAGCGAAAGFLALLGSSKAAVDADGPYRATGVNR